AVWKLTHVVDGNDSRMLKPCDNLSFAPHPRAHTRAGKIAAQHLNRYVSAQLRIFCQIDDRHPAPAEFLDDPILRCTEIRDFCHSHQVVDCFVRNPLQSACLPNNRRASSRYSISLAVSSRKWSCRMPRNSRRTDTRWFVTVVVVSPSSAARVWYETSCCSSR